MSNEINLKLLANQIIEILRMLLDKTFSKQIASNRFNLDIFKKDAENRSNVAKYCNVEEVYYFIDSLKIRNAPGIDCIVFGIL